MVPWYVRQQVLLFLAVGNVTQTGSLRAANSPETLHYGEMIRFLKGKHEGLKDAEFATLAILSRRAFRGREMAVRLARRGLDAGRLDRIAKRDPLFAFEYLFESDEFDFLTSKLSRSVLNESPLCLTRRSAPDGWIALSGCSS